MSDVAIQNPPTLDEFQRLKTAWRHTSDTNTLSCTLYQCWTETHKHCFAYVLCSLEGCRELVAVLPYGPFDVHIELYNHVVGSALFMKTETGVTLYRLRKGREIVEAWALWCGFTKKGE